MDVEVETVARLCSRDGTVVDSLPVKLTMRYAAADPYACTFVFGDGPVWTFARDLLAEGMCSREPVGDGDVQCWRGLAPGLVWLRLSVGSDCALFALTRDDVVRFVRRSYVLVQRDRESEHLDLDLAITRLLEPKP